MKFEFSKVIIIFECILVGYLSWRTLGYIESAINLGFEGSLPYLTTFLGVVFAAYGTSVSFYYNKAKAENVNKINNSAKEKQQDCD